LILLCWTYGQKKYPYKECKRVVRETERRKRRRRRRTRRRRASAPK
jgi:hypothetical protein